MSSGAGTFSLPNLFSQCTYPLRYHRNGDAIAAASDDWYRSGFTHFTQEQAARLAVLLASNVSASIYDDADDRHLRASCDLMNLILLYGDFTDDIASKGNQLIADRITDIFRYPYAYHGNRKNDEPVIKLSRE